MVGSQHVREAMALTAGMITIIDDAIGATILERVGLRPYFGMQDQNVLSSLEDEPGGRASLLIEYNDGVRRIGFDPPARVRVLVTERRLLALYTDEDWRELFDRRADPQ